MGPIKPTSKPRRNAFRRNQLPALEVGLFLSAKRQAGSLSYFPLASLWGVTRDAATRLFRT